MNRIVLISLIALVVTVTAQSDCTLDPAVLQPYSAADATDEQWAQSRRAVLDFVSCDPARVPDGSRATFFEVVRAEFRADHTQHLRRWQAVRPGSEAREDALLIFQGELRSYLGRTTTPADLARKDVILAYGPARAIAGLGRSAMPDVLKALGTPGKPYGLTSAFLPQEEALGALGFWISPAETRFTGREKQQLREVLTDLLAVSNDPDQGLQRRLIAANLRALSQTDDASAERAIRAWIARQKNPSALIPDAHAAARAIAKRRSGKGSGSGS